MWSSCTTRTGTLKSTFRPWLVLWITELLIIQYWEYLLKWVWFLYYFARIWPDLDFILGPSSQNWPAEAGACLSFHHWKHGGGKNCGAGRDETAPGLHRHSARYCTFPACRKIPVWEFTLNIPLVCDQQGDLWIQVLISWAKMRCCPSSAMAPLMCLLPRRARSQTMTLMQSWREVKGRLVWTNSMDPFLGCHF